MPPVVVGAAVGAAVSTAATYYTVGLAAGATLASTFATNFAISLIGSTALSALSGRPSGNFGAQTQGRLSKELMTKQAIANRRVIYGTARVSGPLVYLETTSNNKFLHAVIPLAGHEVTNIPSFFIDDDEIKDKLAILQQPDIQVKVTTAYGNATTSSWTFTDGRNPFFQSNTLKIGGISFSVSINKNLNPYNDNYSITISSFGYLIGYSAVAYLGGSETPVTLRTLPSLANYGNPSGSSTFNRDTLGVSYQSDGDNDYARQKPAYCRPDGYTAEEFQTAIGDPEYSLYNSDGIRNADGEIVNGTYKNRLRIKVHLGTENQEADADLVSESGGKWTNDHRLQGVAYIYLRLQYDQDVFPNGIPNISALVNGKKVFDPRDSTTHFSTNPALCLRDYLLNSDYGLGVSASEINETSFINAANICDETVALSSEEITTRNTDQQYDTYYEEFTVDGFTYTNVDAQGIISNTLEHRYILNGTFETSETPKTIIENVLTSLGGVLTYTAGEFSLKAASYITPSDTLTQDDLRAGVSVKSKESRRDQFNSVKGVFTYQAQRLKPTDYPLITSSTFVAEDNNETVFTNIDFPYTVTPTMAQRLAKIALYSNRQQLSLVFPCNLSAFKYQVGDTIMVNLDRYGFSSKVFEIMKWSLALDQDDNGQPVMGVDLLLKETSSSVYDWNAEETSFVLDNTTLFDAKTVAEPGLTVTDELRIVNEEAVSVLIADVSSSNNSVSQFEVQAKKSTDTEYVTMGKGGTGRYELLSVEDGIVYDVRARAINSLNVRSAFTTETHQVVGKTEPPADVTNFQINIVGTEAHLSWTPVPDLDLSHYIIRHSPLTSGAIFDNANTLIDKVSRPANTAVVPALTGTYFIRSVDKINLLSANATSNVALIENVKNLNFVAETVQDPSFSGNKTTLFDLGGALILDTSINFDDGFDLFDVNYGFFDGGGGRVATEGIYEFDNYIDTGGAFTSRITARILSERLEYVDLFDDAIGQFDDREGFFDGGGTFGNVNVELQIAKTNDDPANPSAIYTPFQKFMVGDYSGRGFKFRAVLQSNDRAATPKLTELKVTVDMAERVYSQSDISSGTDTNGKVVTFTPAFKEISGIGISASNLTSGDYYVITNKSATGFTIEFFNSSNATVDRTFDYVVRGYGELAA